MPEISGIIQNYLEGSIKSIGKTPVIESKSITENGTYTAPEGVDGYSPITVNVPIPEPSLTEQVIISNGTYLPPSGYDGFSKVEVDVSTPTMDDITITQNGTYLPATYNLDGFDEVIVNVPTFVRQDGLYYKTFIEASMTLTPGIYGDFQTTWLSGASIGCTLNGTTDIRSYHKLKVSGRITNSYEYTNKTNLARCQFVFGVTDQIFDSLIYVDYNTGDHIKGRNGITLTNTQDTGEFALEINLDEIESTNLYFFMSLLGISGVFTVSLE